MAKVGSPLIDIELDGTSSSPSPSVSSTSSSSSAAASTSTSQSLSSSSSSSISTASLSSSISPSSLSPSNQSISQTCSNSKKPLASPAVRRIARESNVDIKNIPATGPNGRVLKGDILQFLSSSASSSSSLSSTVSSSAHPSLSSPSSPVVAAAASSEGDRTVPITGLQRIMVQSMTASNNVPQFAFSDEIILDQIMHRYPMMKEYAAKHGVKKFSMFAFVVKAASLALQQYPILNSHVNSTCTQITFKKSHNIGIAMDTPRGLLVPNIKNVQEKSLLEIASELARLQALGKENMISSADLKGGTFSLSNIGTIGGTGGSPLLVVPEVCIAALSKTQILPRYFVQSGALCLPANSLTRSPSTSELQLKPAHVLNVTFSADHRVIDGATLARFGAVFKALLEDPSLMMMHSH
eukprot:TRINITY_DN3156_c0_g1_i1.p1 TRINITY_DN3156_c0_g1~~TRINITY_DN3156_c0_g1_i1.p1  ORF type:complete len:411 (-),score=135.51 TRINITY_DN3156_c0_g1_i1:61-1293(-)